MPIDFAKLQANFPSDDIEWRIGQAGQSGDKVWATALAYVTNRAIMNRLDEVCGANNWKNEYREWMGKAVLCGISIWDEDKKEWVTKYDGSDGSDIEQIKGGLSDAMKRAGYQWGIGRYLYDLPATFAIIADDSDKSAKRGEYKNKEGQKKYFRWKPPALPTWALPSSK